MEQPKSFVLDTNVLIHDPNAVFSFEEHDVLIPMVVLEELDKLKAGSSSIAADCRQAVRNIDNILGNASPEEVLKGVPIQKEEGDPPLGRLSIVMQGPDINTHYLNNDSNDNRIINLLLHIKNHQPGRDIVLITKDINMRLKARGCGLYAEDYHNDQLITDIDRLTTGYHTIKGSFWETLDAIEPQQLTGDRLHRVPRYVFDQVLEDNYNVNQFVVDGKEFVGLIRHVDSDMVDIELLNTGMLMRQKTWGLSPRDIYQAMSMFLLMDPEVDLVSLNGPAGSGKTILALACALEMTIEQKLYNRIIATRSTRGLDEDIGFLPGTESEKMMPWLGAFTDNLEALHAEDYDPSGSSDYVGNNMPIHFKSLNFVRGRSFQNTFLIVDEAQNLTPHQIKTIITRAGEGTKVLCLGNLAQIDTPYLNATSSGITYMSERFKGFQHGGSLSLQGVARSRLAAYAETHL